MDDDAGESPATRATQKLRAIWGMVPSSNSGLKEKDNPRSAPRSGRRGLRDVTNVSAPLVPISVANPSQSLTDQQAQPTPTRMAGFSTLGAVSMPAAWRSSALLSGTDTNGSQAEIAQHPTISEGQTGLVVSVGTPQGVDLNTASEGSVKEESPRMPLEPMPAFETTADQGASDSSSSAIQVSAACGDKGPYAPDSCRPLRGRRGGIWLWLLGQSLTVV